MTATEHQEILFKCPKCSLALRGEQGAQANSFQCANHHNFDRAREGHVNLLLAQNKNSKNPGDDLLMVKSRRAFLNAGYYSFLANQLALSIAKKVKNKGESLLDLGCGEGYYLEQLQARLDAVLFAGVDISKHAIKLAAKRVRQIQFAVASNYELPFFDNTFDLALSIFSPVNPDQAQRVLKPGGYLIMVGPGPEHLRQLAQHIYQSTERQTNNFTAIESSLEFSLETTHSLAKQIQVSGENITQLLAMTPYYWKASAEQQKTIESLRTLITQVQFEIKIYQCVKTL